MKCKPGIQHESVTSQPIAAFSLPPVSNFKRDEEVRT